MIPRALAPGGTAVSQMILLRIGSKPVHNGLLKTCIACTDSIIGRMFSSYNIIANKIVFL